MRLLLEAVYPSRCALCDVLGPTPICHECREAMPPNADLVPGPEPLLFHAALYRYHDRAGQAVRRLKYERATALVAPLAHEVAEAAERMRKDFDLAVPVPIHWSRRAMRGFNQSELLAEQIAWRRNDVLRRIRRTRPQVGLKHEVRLRQLQGAFAAKPDVRGLRILLIDDVFTSGGTAIACANALLEAGASGVAALTLTVG